MGTCIHMLVNQPLYFLYKLGYETEVSFVQWKLVMAMASKSKPSYDFPVLPTLVV